MSHFGTCHVVADNDCKAPAAYACNGGMSEEPPARVGVCFMCGQDVCTNPGCSSRVMYRGKRVRLCDECRTETEGSR